MRFQQGLADRFHAGLVRSGQWRDHIQKSLRAAGVPEELAALPHVESSFDPNARSFVGAAGLWQFTGDTGRRFMQIDQAVDERRDPYESSDAAARLLKYNYSMLNTWPLAITAYNHGTAGMRRAVDQMRHRRHRGHRPPLRRAGLRLRVPQFLRVVPGGAGDREESRASSSAPCSARRRGTSWWWSCPTTCASTRSRRPSACPALDLAGLQPGTAAAGLGGREVRAAGLSPAPAGRRRDRGGAAPGAGRDPGQPALRRPGARQDPQGEARRYAVRHRPALRHQRREARPGERHQARRPHPGRPGAEAARARRRRTGAGGAGEAEPAPVPIPAAAPVPTPRLRSAGTAQACGGCRCGGKSTGGQRAPSLPRGRAPNP